MFNYFAVKIVNTTPPSLFFFKTNLKIVEDLEKLVKMNHAEWEMFALSK